MKKIKVLLFTDTFCDMNGVSRFIQDLSLISHREGLDLIIVTSSVKKCPHFENVKIFKPKFRMKIPFYPELDLVVPSYEELRKYTDSINPDVIHVSTPGFVGWMGRKIAMKKGIPILGTYHTDFPNFAYSNLPFEIVRTIGNKIMQSFYKDFSALFTRSEFYKNIVHEDIKIDLEQIYTLQAGIDVKKFNPTYKDRKIWDKYDIPNDATIVLYVGRLTKEKNFPFLLDIWKNYYGQSLIKNVYLVVVGGELKDKTLFSKYNIKTLGIKKGEELSEIYASSDFFLFPSTTDTLGQVVMEAMGSGLPVIVSDKGGPKSLLDDANQRGYAINIERKKKWIDTIEDLHLNTKLRKKLGENGTQYIAHLTIEKSFAKFWSVHSEILKV